MKNRRRERRVHIIIVSVLASVLGVLFIAFISVLATSGIVANEAKKGIENMECDFCEELVAKIRVEEEAAAQKAMAEKIANAVGIVYLTFDDGPGDHTERLLDILDTHNIKVTFFVTGRGSDETIKRESDEGHTVAMHTWSHKYNYVYASVANYFADLAQIADRVKNVTGKESNIIRFPGGSSNTVSARYDGRTKIMSTLVNEVTARGYTYFDWNVDSDDAGRAKSADVVYNNVVSHLKPGANVVLQHDIYDYSVDAVERIIEYGEANGYVFLPIKEDTAPVHHGVNN
ncbi:polysaccharide deacetylase [Candidatus Saccharibacteria bacterium]|nr:polysaccharide deacetylase [Candidatus Saccharibacteria bacterium]